MTQDPPKTIWVKNQRKDGKFTVVYVFPVSNVRLTKIRSREQLEAERPNYQIMGLPPEAAFNIMHPIAKLAIAAKDDSEKK